LRFGVFSFLRNAFFFFLLHSIPKSGKNDISKCRIPTLIPTLISIYPDALSRKLARTGGGLAEVHARLAACSVRKVTTYNVAAGNRLNRKSAAATLSRECTTVIGPSSWWSKQGVFSAAGKPPQILIAQVHGFSIRAPKACRAAQTSDFPIERGCEFDCHAQSDSNNISHRCCQLCLISRPLFHLRIPHFFERTKASDNPIIFKHNILHSRGL